MSFEIFLVLFLFSIAHATPGTLYYKTLTCTNSATISGVSGNYITTDRFHSVTQQYDGSNNTLINIQAGSNNYPTTTTLNITYSSTNYGYLFTFGTSSFCLQESVNYNTAWSNCISDINVNLNGVCVYYDTLTKTSTGQTTAFCSLACDPRIGAGTTSNFNETTNFFTWATATLVGGYVKVDIFAASSEAGFSSNYNFDGGFGQCTGGEGFKYYYNETPTSHAINTVFTTQPNGYTCMVIQVDV